MRKPLRYAPFYERWLGPPPILEDRLGEALDCGDCAMKERYRADLKCCTFFPFLPNFVIGAIFHEGHPATLNKLRSALTTANVSPLGLRASEGWKELRSTLGVEAFGQATELLCPFFDRLENNCGIWKFRPGVCANYFCRSSLSPHKWKKSEESINLVEWTLAHCVLWELGLTKDETDVVAATGEWFEFGDDKEGFFRRCYEKGLSLSDREVEELLGFET